MAILLGAATALARAPEFKGTVHFIFQPAEELLNGAGEMIAAGLFEQFPCDEIYALHNAPSLGVGVVAVRTGPILAACDDFTIVVKGRGVHAALPHLGADPIVAAAHLIVALQTVVSRSLDPTESGVVTIGMISGGTSPNVIPESVILRGTFRSASVGAREQSSTTRPAVLPACQMPRMSSTMTKSFPAPVAFVKSIGRVIVSS